MEDVLQESAKRRARRAIDQVVEKAGSQEALAKSIGVSQQAISQWQQQGWVPVRRAEVISGLYGVNPIDLMPPLIQRLARMV